MTTLRDIASQADVSIATVSDVLNGKYAGMGPRAQRRAQQIQAIADQLGYRPDAAARAIKTRRRRTIGVVVQSHGLVLETLLGLSDGLQEAGYLVVNIPFNQTTDRTLESRIFSERVTDGIVVVDGVPDRLVSTLETAGPTVWVNANVWHERGCVRRDEVAAGRAAAEGLAALGYRRIVYVGPQPDAHHFAFADRFAGVREVAQTHKLEVEVAHVGMTATGEEIDALLPSLDPETAVLAADAYQVRRLQNGFMRRRLSPGTDFALACCDDAEDFNLMWPELARVKFDRYLMGRQAAELMLETLQADAACASRRFEGEFMPGDSARRRGAAHRG